MQANALGKAGKWPLLLELLEDMKADGNPPTNVAFKAAVDCCSKVCSECTLLAFTSSIPQVEVIA